MLFAQRRAGRHAASSTDSLRCAQVVQKKSWSGTEVRPQEVPVQAEAWPCFMRDRSENM